MERPKPGDTARVTGVDQCLGQVVRVERIGGIGHVDDDVYAQSADGKGYVFRADQLAKVEE
jgi:hypothetical protein